MADEEDRRSYEKVQCIVYEKIQCMMYLCQQAHQCFVHQLLHTLRRLLQTVGPHL
jgi:hypothetical protein